MKKPFILFLVILAALFGCTSCSLNFKGGVDYIAHRGLSAEYYDNSLAAYQAAADSDTFWGIETDIRYTKDGIFVTVHDETPFFENGTAVQDLTYEEGLRLPLNREGTERLCLFEDYLKICRDSGKIAVIEIKFSHDAKWLEEALTFIKKYLTVDEFVIIAFSEETLDYLAQNHKDITLQWLINDEKKIPICLEKGYNISLYHKLLTEKIVSDFHNASLKVGVWTLNEQAQIDDAIALSVDYITTNG